MHGWLYVEMAGLFVSEKPVRGFPFLSERHGFEAIYFETAIILISFPRQDLA
jgi:hypothetical protein